MSIPFQDNFSVFFNSDIHLYRIFL